MSADPWEITPEDRDALLEANRRRLGPGQPHPMYVLRNRLKPRVTAHYAERERRLVEALRAIRDEIKAFQPQLWEDSEWWGPMLRDADEALATLETDDE